VIGLYCSNAYHGSRAANYVQTINTALGLGKHLDKLEVVVRGTNLRSSTESISKNVVLRTLYGTRGKLGGGVFLVLTILQLLKIKIMALVHGKQSFVFVRNIYAGFLTPFLLIDFRAIELHTLPSFIQLRLLKIYLSLGNSKIIVITQALKDDMAIALDMDLAGLCIVVADAHNASKNYSEQALSQREKGSNHELKIAYFGSLNTYKGSELLFEIIRNTNYRVDIYTKDTIAIPNDILEKCKSGYVEHNQVQNIMLDYDVTFLFLNQTGLADDVSKYTSPLKLFECLAAGLIVMCSNCEVLREVVDDSSVIFVENDARRVVDELHSLSADTVRRKALAKAAITVSLEHTYDSRSSSIFYFVQS